MLMTYQEFNQLAGAIQSLVTVLALAIGGYWAYWRFIRQREGRPNVEFSADIVFIRKQGEWWIVELFAWLENKGKARHLIKDFYFDVRALYADDLVIVDDERFRGQVYFPNEVAAGWWMPEEKNETFIDPGVKTHYSYIARVPERATLLLMHTWFNYSDETVFTSTEKIVSVPSVQPEDA
jgi:hypothetical protein